MNLKISKKKFIYLISPNKIYPQFYKDLKEILETGKVQFFQMRLKKYSLKEKILIGKKIQQICKKNSTKFLVNDDPILSKKLNADGCHLGQKDMDIKNARKIIGNKIIGVTCHNSIRLAKTAIKEKANYIAFGAFFSTITKKVKFKATTKILNKAKKLTKVPIVAIGGINFDNYKKLLLNNANLLAISSYVWNNKNYKPIESIKKLK
ncbi:thiamine phosphate synthase [Candidatus Pelagibacter sp.]|nr:thiamine phosphate synthase [Candidatus Pelagibacter sp.]